MKVTLDSQWGISMRVAVNVTQKVAMSPKWKTLCLTVSLLSKSPYFRVSIVPEIQLYLFVPIVPASKIQIYLFVLAVPASTSRRLYLFVSTVLALKNRLYLFVSAVPVSKSCLYLFVSTVLVLKNQLYLFVSAVPSSKTRYLAVSNNPARKQRMENAADLQDSLLFQPSATSCDVFHTFMMQQSTS